MKILRAAECPGHAQLDTGSQPSSGRETRGPSPLQPSGARGPGTRGIREPPGSPAFTEELVPGGEAAGEMEQELGVSMGDREVPHSGEAVQRESSGGPSPPPCASCPPP